MTATAPGVIHVESYADVVDKYECHPEAKCATADGSPSDKLTKGLYARRHIIIDSITYIGKESNELEEVEAGMATADDVYTQFLDKRRDFWSTKVLPAMRDRTVSIRKLVIATGLSRRTLIDARLGKRRPHKKHRQRIVTALVRLGVLMPSLVETGNR